MKKKRKKRTSKDHLHRSSDCRSSDLESVGDILARVIAQRGDVFRRRLENARRDVQSNGRNGLCSPPYHP
jgi:hypothetical protein